MTTELNTSDADVSADGPAATDKATKEGRDFSSMLGRAFKIVPGLSTLVGGVYVFWYFYGIRYLPSVTLSDLSIVFLFLASVALIFVLALVVLPIALGAFWYDSVTSESMNWAGAPIIRRTGGEVEESLGCGRLHARQVLRVGLWFALPTGLFNLVLVLTLTNERSPDSLAWMMIASAFYVTVLRLQFVQRWKSIGTYMANLLPGVVISLLGVVLWTAITESFLDARSASASWSQVIAMIFLVLATATAFAAPPPGIASGPTDLPGRIRWSLYSAAALTCVMALITVTALTPSVMMRLAGVGNLTNSTLVVDESGKDLLVAYGFDSYQELPGPTYEFSGIDVLWERSDPLVLAADDADVENPDTSRRTIVTFERAHLVSLQIGQSARGR